jgi:hypothetical protein
VTTVGGDGLRSILHLEVGQLTILKVSLQTNSVTETECVRVSTTGPVGRGVSSVIDRSGFRYNLQNAQLPKLG